LSTLTFTIRGHKVATTDEGEVWTGQLQSGAESQRSLREAIGAAAESSGDRSASQEAADWLTDYLTSQGGVATRKDIEKAGREAGHTVTAIRRGRERLRVRTENRGYPRQTYWHLPVASPVASVSGETTKTDMTDTTGASRASRVSRASLQTDDSTGDATGETGGKDSFYGDEQITDVAG
jgi:hypothetical protein